jgi:hypothetical protein
MSTRKPFRSITLTALVVTAMGAVSNAEAWSFATPAGDYRGHGVRPELVGSRSHGGFSFGYNTGGFNSCSQPHGGFYAECLYGGSSFGPSTSYVPPTYGYPSYAPGFYNRYDDGYYRGYYDGQRNRYGRRHKRFRSR